MKINDCEMFLRSKTFPDFTCRHLYVHTDIHTAKLLPASRPALPKVERKGSGSPALPGSLACGGNVSSAGLHPSSCSLPSPEGT